MTSEAVTPKEPQNLRTSWCAWNRNLEPRRYQTYHVTTAAHCRTGTGTSTSKPCGTRTWNPERGILSEPRHVASGSARATMYTQNLNLGNVYPLRNFPVAIAFLYTSTFDLGMVEILRYLAVHRIHLAAPALTARYSLPYLHYIPRSARGRRMSCGAVRP